MKTFLVIILGICFAGIASAQPTSVQKKTTAIEYLQKAPRIPDSLCFCSQQQKEEFLSAVSELMETIKSDAEDRHSQTSEYMQSKEEQMKTNMMKQSGLNDEEMAKMKSGKKLTEAEKNAMINRMMQQKMNMSLDEVKNLKNMSKEGQQAWAQGYAAEQQAVAQANPQQKNEETDKAKSAMALQAEITALHSKVEDMQQGLKQEWASLEQEAAAGKMIMDKELEPLRVELAKTGDGEGATQASIDRANRLTKQIEARQDKYCRQYTPKLLAFLKKCKPMVEKSFPDNDRLEQLELQSTSATTGVNLQPKSLGIASITSVNLYLGFLEKAFNNRLH